MSVLQAQDLSKWYGDVIGLNDVDLEIGHGITGLLGPNGAGKSTLFRLAVGLARPSAGQIRVLGQDPWDNQSLSARVGYVPEGEPAWRDKAARDALTFHGQLGGLDSQEARDAAERALAEVGLDDAATKTVEAMSMGMRQRLKLAMALLHDPELLILDEPLTGTDPVTRRELIGLIQALPDQGRSAIVSTHVLEDLEAMTDRVAVLHKGRLYAHGTVGEIRDLIDQVPRRIFIGTGDVRGLGTRVWQLASVVGMEALDQGVVAHTRDPQAFFTSFQEAVLADGLEITSLSVMDEDLSSIFNYLVGSS